MFFLFFGIAPAHAISSVGWDCITDNSVPSCNTATGGAQLSISAFGANQAAFDWGFTGAIGSMTDVYLDVPTTLLTDLAQLINGTGMDFSEGASPPNLPGGGGGIFVASYSADSNSPNVPLNGIQNGDGLLRLIFDIGNTFDFTDVSACFIEGTCLAGAHVQALDGGESEGIIALFQTSAVPEPGAFVLLALGLVGLAFFGGRKAEARITG